MAIKIKNWGLLLYALTSHALISAQATKKDTLENWISGYSTWSRINVSDNGRWLLARKLYYKNTDSIMVFDTERPGVPVDHLVRKNIRQSFLGQHCLLALGADTLVLKDLLKGTTDRFVGIRKADVVPSRDQFFILHTDGALGIYGSSGRSNRVFREVESVVSDNRSQLYYQKKNNNMIEVFNGYNKKEEPIYSTALEIVNTSFSESGDHLFLTEKNKEGALNLIIIRTKDDHLLRHSITPVVSDYIRATELLSGKERSLFVSFIKKQRADASAMVDVWYTNDLKLRQKISGVVSQSAWLVDLNSLETEKLPSLSTHYIPTGISRYFLAYDTEESDNYVDPTATFDIKLFDSDKTELTPVLTKVSAVIFAKDKKQFLLYNTSDRIWYYYDVLKREIFPIHTKGTTKPIFSADGRRIYFGGLNDLWVYDILRHRLMPTQSFSGKNVRISNVKTTELDQFSRLQISMQHLDSNLLLLDVQDKTSKKSAYYSFNKGKTKMIIPWKDRRLKDFAASKNNSFYSIEETYNSYPQIYKYTANASVEKLLSSVPAKDSTGLDGIKREILKYRNSLGVELEGHLYYPKNFTESKSFPVIVKVYQEQNGLAHHYLLPQVDEEGFNIRMLLERGYFVFLPDTIVDERGPGISALDCVNSGLDAILKYSYIDQSKIGLTGHSFGGYETNFIATRSDRFAAYVSGSGISSLITKYFTYNYPLQMPDYSRMELAQYQMKRSYAENGDHYRENNPIDHIQDVRSPILLWTGMKDENVSPDETMAFYIGLLRNKKPAIALFYRDKGHSLGMLTPESLDLTTRCLEWWDYFLKGQRSVDWINEIMKKDAQ
ncbi:prolyl oligopeptidase family serine peptidase [Epilithonimonas ginsengisoli]|uniref:Prolyl oligopeptidase family serine peptidase n=1 Tax=Epilithonimonas ginsengisoli TaxID=1245592 RepID=A0ABU4JJZ4_9FLAO|nr:MULTISPECIES: prolyl oligopeptidase family serine peptidase [Chryseobacterium group]MBV6880457.1 prolyl oligopeptidase family serine peptidase [Epilithonimonas sp. FP105]MDW8550026.1 prolyl oligopeptidase family serine peptidase [Epilithonimonas ginsengisoli]OAH69206.1 hypothetical protein AXA65_15385 [Chryseobacterium sp. FP211-J200]